MHYGTVCIIQYGGFRMELVSECNLVCCCTLLHTVSIRFTDGVGIRGQKGKGVSLKNGVWKGVGKTSHQDTHRRVVVVCLSIICRCAVAVVE